MLHAILIKGNDHSLGKSSSPTARSEHADPSNYEGEIGEI